MIPKIIHYVWVGNNPKPKSVLDCIETWKMFLPDYKIIEWGNDSLKEINCDYAREAFYHEEWAFVSDYIRLYALKNFGGIYFDTDVEVTNSFDEFLSLDFFSCHESFNNICLPITSAVMGAKKESQIIIDLLNIYEKKHFSTNGSLDKTPNTIYITQYLEHKFNITEPYIEKNLIKMSDSEIIFPFYYFCIRDDNYVNYSIHHFSGSWVSSHSRKDKLNIFNTLLISRFNKNRDKGTLPLLSHEKILLSIKISKKKSYNVILRKTKKIEKNNSF